MSNAGFREYVRKLKIEMAASHPAKDEQDVLAEKMYRILRVIDAESARLEAKVAAARKDIDRSMFVLWDLSELRAECDGALQDAKKAASA